MISVLPAEKWAGIVTERVGRRAHHHIFRHTPFPAVALVALALLAVNDASPWRGALEDHGSAFHSIAINHIRSGLAVPKGQDLIDHEAGQRLTPTGMSEDGEFASHRLGQVHAEVYGGHPRLLPWLYARRATARGAPGVTQPESQGAARVIILAG